MEFRRNEEAGKFFSVEEVMSILEAERIFLEQSGGGVTFSGGEPMNQPEFLLEALKACKLAGYHTAVDTSGYSMPENYRKIVPYTDLFLYDLKLVDNEKHFLYSAVSNELILENFRMLSRSGKNIMIRIPVIPGLNDDTGDLMKMKKFILENKVKNLIKICLLPYHRIGATKYKRFRMIYRMDGIDPPSASRMRELKEFFSETGIKVKVGG